MAVQISLGSASVPEIKHVRVFDILCSHPLLFHATQFLCLVTNCAGFDKFTKTISSGIWTIHLPFFLCTKEKFDGSVLNL